MAEPNNSFQNNIGYIPRLRYDKTSIVAKIRPKNEVDKHMEFYYQWAKNSKNLKENKKYFFL